ncbi:MULTISPECIES: alpha/beta fold hydrolase [Haloferax]|uniref:alpha/beta fold hydrolase n=1 Tax=Haloferax TaxID=2251 RepID=UPI0012B02613|nr:MULTISPECIES: alpha/beta hydrolase [Haloferax]
MYDRAVDDLLSVSVESLWVDTLAGPTHCLVAGDEHAQPLLVFQGGNVTTPVTLAWVQSLADDYRLVAPDTPGEPGLSADERPADYGAWVVDVLDAFDLDAAPMVGLSHGAGVVLEAATVAPDRVAAAALVVPAGFGTAITPALARVVVPSLAYRLIPNRRLLRWALGPLFSAPVDDVPDVVVETVALALRTSDLSAEFPGPGGPDALADFDGLTLVVVADGDPFFPPERTLDRAIAWLLGPVETRVLTDERHFLSPMGQEEVSDAVRSFLAADSR